MTKKQINLYIGANNQTCRLERMKIELILDKYFKGYSLIESKGVWEALSEDSLKVEIIDLNGQFNEEKIIYICLELKEALKQECVLYTITTLKCGGLV